MHSSQDFASPGEAFIRSPSDITVDAEGDWYYQGNHIFREDIIEFLLENVLLTPDGRYYISWNEKECSLEAADTPFVVSRVDLVKESDSGTEKLSLKLRHLSGEVALDPTTLRVGKGNVLYCSIREGRFPARFLRPAYYQIAQWIEEDQTSSTFFIELNGSRYPIPLS